jgi:hypothetical protein
MRLKAVFALTSLLSASAIAASALGGAACGKSEESTSTNGGDAGQTPIATPGQPPDPPAAPATTSADVRTFAVTSFTLGDVDRTGNPNAEAWRELGYDVDHLTTATEADLAKTCSGATKNVLDGANGIDNSFGKNIVALIGNVNGSPSKNLTTAALEGRFTLLIQVKGLTDDPAQTNTGLTGAVFFATPFGGDPDSGVRPTFTQADDWPYRNDTHVDLPSAYVVKSELVNGAGTGEFPLALALAGTTVVLTVHHGTITFTHDPANQALVNGTISGVVDTQALVDSMDALASRFTPPICPGPTLELVKSAIAASSDILNDGTQDPAKPCNGISIGLGFEAKRVGNPTKPVPPSAESQENPCDAGP